MKASDVMVSEVITVGRDTTVREIANILVANHISAVPVVDDGGALIGIVSEGDLVHRVEVGTDHAYSWWFKLISDQEMMSRDYLKSHATRASDVMTKRVVTASPDMPLSKLASLLNRHKIKRVPIVNEAGELVGIVSRANLVQALANLRPIISVGSRNDDSTLRERVRSEITSHMLAGFSQINVIVQDGVVELWGDARSSAEKDAIRVAAELVPGVRKVEDHIAICEARYRI
jgi:CBS domain-containing protein